MRRYFESPDTLLAVPLELDGTRAVVVVWSHRPPHPAEGDGASVRQLAIECLGPVLVAKLGSLSGAKWITAADIERVSLARSKIETQVVSELAERYRRHGTSLREPERINAELEKAARNKNTLRFVERDAKFHASLARLAGFFDFADFLLNLWYEFNIVALPTSVVWEVETKLEHDRILQAIRSGQRGLADGAMRRHLDNGRRRWLFTRRGLVQA